MGYRDLRKQRRINGVYIGSERAEQRSIVKESFDGTWTQKNKGKEGQKSQVQKGVWREKSAGKWV